VTPAEALAWAAEEVERAERIRRDRCAEYCAATASDEPNAWDTYNAAHGELADARAALRTAERYAARVASEPERLALWCPKCGARHLDEGEWATRPHRTHLCLACGETWRPSERATVGVGPSVTEAADALAAVVDRVYAADALQEWWGVEGDGLKAALKAYRKAREASR
jgi:hypothetical protein